MKQYEYETEVRSIPARLVSDYEITDQDELIEALQETCLHHEYAIYSFKALDVIAYSSNRDYGIKIGAVDLGSHDNILSAVSALAGWALYADVYESDEFSDILETLEQ